MINIYFGKIVVCACNTKIFVGAFFLRRIFPVYGVRHGACMPIDIEIFLSLSLALYSESEFIWNDIVQCMHRVHSAYTCTLHNPKNEEQKKKNKRNKK